ncbi:hypothetical protein [uncultured Methanobrevibacter sp.]|jgi:hypothetical protein|uniref:hypothetical protein n=1 Tax=uncultured Methanobrevibacter sp. TaxID=253161 RepID=UPI0025EB505F|nr:hypothetical protein [uncultured Methanobrevibacter sp.]
MKKLFFILIFLASTVCYSQVDYFKIVYDWDAEITDTVFIKTLNESECESLYSLLINDSCSYEFKGVYYSSPRIPTDLFKVDDYYIVISFSDRTWEKWKNDITIFRERYCNEKEIESFIKNLQY